MISEHDLARVELLALGDGVDPLALDLDALTIWVSLSAGCHCARRAPEVAQALKARAVVRALA